MPQCTKCKKEFTEEQLNLGESGAVCDSCQLEVDESERAGAEFKNAYLAVAGAVAGAVVGNAISSRETTSTSFSFGEHGSSATHQSADMFKLGGGGLGLLCALVGLWVAIRLKAEGSKKTTKLVIIVVLIVVGAWAAWTLAQGLPSSTQKEW